MKQNEARVMRCIVGKVMACILLCSSCVPRGAETQAQPAALDPAVPSGLVATESIVNNEAWPTDIPQGQALLVSGSIPVYGLPGLGPNAFSALTGEYAYRPVRPDAASIEAPLLGIRVWSTRQALLYPESWLPPAPSCSLLSGSTVLAAPVDTDGSFLWAIQAREYALFIRFPGTMTDPCRFASVLSERFAFFFRYAETSGDVSFPAVLELGL